MDDLKGDADELGTQLLLPFLIIVAVIVLAIFVYCLFQRLSRTSTRVVDIGSLREISEAKERAAALRKDIELHYSENSEMQDAKAVRKRMKIKVKRKAARPEGSQFYDDRNLPQREGQGTICTARNLLQTNEEETQIRGETLSQQSGSQSAMAVSNIPIKLRNKLDGELGVSPLCHFSLPSHQSRASNTQQFMLPSQSSIGSSLSSSSQGQHSSRTTAQQPELGQNNLPLSQVTPRSGLAHGETTGIVFPQTPTPTMNKIGLSAWNRMSLQDSIDEEASESAGSSSRGLSLCRDNEAASPDVFPPKNQNASRSGCKKNNQSEARKRKISTVRQPSSKEASHLNQNSDMVNFLKKQKQSMKGLKQEYLSTPEQPNPISREFDSNQQVGNLTTQNTPVFDSNGNTPAISQLTPEMRLDSLRIGEEQRNFQVTSKLSRNNMPSQLLSTIKESMSSSVEHKYSSSSSIELENTLQQQATQLQNQRLQKLQQRLKQDGSEMAAKQKKRKKDAIDGLQKIRVDYLQGSIITHNQCQAQSQQDALNASKVDSNETVTLATGVSLADSLRNTTGSKEIDEAKDKQYEADLQVLEKDLELRQTQLQTLKSKKSARGRQSVSQGQAAAASVNSSFCSQRRQSDRSQVDSGTVTPTPRTSVAGRSVNNHQPDGGNYLVNADYGEISFEPGSSSYKRKAEKLIKYQMEYGI